MNRVVSQRPPVRRANPARPGAAATARPSEAVLRFRKVLELEQRRGADDGAVIGGIDRFLANARADKGVEAVLNGAPPLPKGYHALSVAQRQAWIRGALAAKPKAPEKKAAKAAAKPVAAAPSVLSKAPPPADPLDCARHRDQGRQGSAAGQAGEARRAHGSRPALPLPQPPQRLRRCAPDLRAACRTRSRRPHGQRLELDASRASAAGPAREATVGDETGTMRVVWFNQPYLADQLQDQRPHRHRRQGRPVQPPEDDGEPGVGARARRGDLTHTGRLVPVYPLTAGAEPARAATRRQGGGRPLRASRARRRCRPTCASATSLPGHADALRQMHYPDTTGGARSGAAAHGVRGAAVACSSPCSSAAAPGRRAARRRFERGRHRSRIYRAALPFTLTGAQERVLGDILGDIAARPADGAAAAGRRRQRQDGGRRRGAAVPSRTATRARSWRRPRSWPSSTTAP